MHIFIGIRLARRGKHRQIKKSKFIQDRWYEDVKAFPFVLQLDIDVGPYKKNLKFRFNKRRRKKPKTNTLIH